MTGRRFAAFADVVLAAAVIAAVDGIVFHAGLYFRWLALDSYSGRVEQTCRRFEIARALLPGVARVILVGDSRTDAAIDERVFDGVLATRGMPMRAFDFAQGGTAALTWNVLLLNEPISGANTALAVVGVTPWSAAEPGHRLPEIDIVKTRLRISDALWLAASFDELEGELRVLSAALFRTPLFREDLLDFARAPRTRFEQLARRREQERSYGNDYRRGNDSTRSVPPATAYEKGRLRERRLPPSLREDARTKAMIRLRLRRLEIERSRGQPALVVDRTFGQLLERLIRVLDERGVPVVVAILPDTPYPSRCRDTLALHDFCDGLAAGGIDVEIFDDEALLAELEAPRYFNDHVHVNGPGALLYTSALADFVANRLSGGGSRDPAPRRSGSAAR